MVPEILGLATRPIIRTLKVLDFISNSENNEASYYSITDKIYFEIDKKNTCLDIVLDDLVLDGYLEKTYDQNHKYYSMTNKANKLLQDFRLLSKEIVTEAFIKRESVYEQKSEDNM